MASNDMVITILEAQPISPTRPPELDRKISSRSATATTSIPVTCSICGIQFANTRKLKTHLLLKHPELNMCLYCVEKKGWSDNFASQSQYNQHYKDCHKNSPPSAAIARNMPARKRKACDQDEKVRIFLNKKPSKILCFLCDEKPIFQNPLEQERHMISVHGHDYCKLCFLMGPIATVRYHILDQHSNTLCPICCSQSPLFNSGRALRYHLLQSHGFAKEAKSTIYPCYDCNKENMFKNISDYQSHLLNFHLTKGDALKPMRKKRVRPGCSKNSENSEEFKSSSSEGLKRVVAIRNDSGQDCFAISVLHLLAQTEIPKHLEAISHHSKCAEPSCLLAHFFDRYRKSQKRSLSILEIAQNYKNFGIDDQPVDCGDFLRSCLACLSKGTPEHGGNGQELRSLFNVALQWKFECDGCKRFMVMSMEDQVLRVDGSRGGSFEELLNNFLHEKKCRCGQKCRVYPGVKSSGKYLFVEVNRSCDTGNDVKELILYSLQLKDYYSVFGFRYSMFGVINYNLELEGGGHYVTNLFPDEIDLVRIHEQNWKSVKRRPDFDCDTVIVALKKVEMTSSDLVNHIEIEIEYEKSSDISDTRAESETEQPLNNDSTTNDEQSQDFGKVKGGIPSSKTSNIRRRGKKFKTSLCDKIDQEIVLERSDTNIDSFEQVEELSSENDFFGKLK